MAGGPRAPEDVETIVRGIVARVANRGADWSGDADIFHELEVKSAAALELLLTLEEEFGIAIEDRAFSDARTTNQIVAFIQAVIARNE
jgi:acyl carrier protein